MEKLDRVVVAEKGAFPKLTEIYAKTPLETIRAWQAFHVADNAAPYLSKPFTDAYFEMRDKTLSGQEEQRVRWKRAVTRWAAATSAPAIALELSARWVSGSASFTPRNIFRPRRRRRSKRSSLT